MRDELQAALASWAAMGGCNEPWLSVEDAAGDAYCRSMIWFRLCLMLCLMMVTDIIKHRRMN